MEVLDELEGGRIDAAEALRRLEAGPSEPEDAPPAGVGRGRRAWWLVPFCIGLGLTALGGWLAALGGGWWFGAVPLLLIGIPLMALGAISRTSPWVHVRIRSREGSRPRRIVISLPIPLRPVAWVFRTFRPWIHGLDDTAIDELILTLDGNVSPESPLYVHVDDEEDGEQIEVFLG